MYTMDPISIKKHIILDSKCVSEYEVKNKNLMHNDTGHSMQLHDVDIAIYHMVFVCFARLLYVTCRVKLIACEVLHIMYEGGCYFKTMCRPLHNDVQPLLYSIN